MSYILDFHENANHKNATKGGNVSMTYDTKSAKDLPVGLMMSLAQNKTAMRAFSNLTPDGQERVIQYVTSAATGKEAKEHIHTAVDCLAHGDTGFC